jgi:uncharacterized membrane protein required for colicin V production
MVSLDILFWIFIVVFALIGAIRGWAKELLVTFSVFMALFCINVLENQVSPIKSYLANNPITNQVWLRMIVLTAVVFFGYQTPNFPRISEHDRFMREHFQDAILGALLGGFNGFLIFGSVWYFLHAANYPFTIIIPPIAGTPAGEAALKLIPLLAPTWLGTPVLYYAVAIAFVFILVVFI